MKVKEKEGGSIFLEMLLAVVVLIGLILGADEIGKVFERYRAVNQFLSNGLQAVHMTSSRSSVHEYLHNVEEEVCRSMEEIAPIILSERPERDERDIRFAVRPLFQLDTEGRPKLLLDIAVRKTLSGVRLNDETCHSVRTQLPQILSVGKSVKGVMTLHRQTPNICERGQFFRFQCSEKGA